MLVLNPGEFISKAMYIGPNLRFKVNRRVYRRYSIYVYNKDTNHYRLLDGSYVRYKNDWVHYDEFCVIQRRLGQRIVWFP